MSILIYSGYGFATIYGSATAAALPAVTHLWDVGQILFVVGSAKKGFLEAVAIKRVLVNGTPMNQSVVLYKDTYNGLWNEEELCTQDEAAAFIDAYVADQDAASFAWAMRNHQPPGF